MRKFSLIIVVTILVLSGCKIEQPNSDLMQFIHPTGEQQATISENQLKLCSNYPNIIIKMKKGENKLTIPSTLVNIKSTFTLNNSLYLKATVLLDNSVISTIKQIEKIGSVAYVEPAYKKSLTVAIDSFTPNDLFSATYQYSLSLSNANEAYESYGVGASIPQVAIIDTGLNFPHEEFAGLNSITFYTYFDKSVIVEDSYYYTYTGMANKNPVGFQTQNWDEFPGEQHGTHVAGIIGAIGNNSMGICGVCPGNINLTIFKSFASSSNGSFVEISEDNWALYNPLAQLIIDPARDETSDTMVVNMSFGGPEASKLGSDLISQALAVNILCVSASGNSGYVHVFYPASYNEVISVSSVDRSSAVSTFSSGAQNLCVAAPGEDIYSTGSSDNSDYLFMSGTSMAAPFVTGLAAYALTFDETLTPSQLKTVIEESANDLGETGWDNRYGHGLVDVKETIKRVIETTINTNYCEEAVIIEFDDDNTIGETVYLYKENIFFALAIIRDESGTCAKFNLLPTGSYKITLNYNETVYQANFEIDASLTAPAISVINI